MGVLRPYQTESVESIINAFKSGYTKVLATASVGAGKSFLIADIVRRAKGRVLVMCHSIEVLEQNEQAIKQFGVEDVGVFCAKSRGRKQTQQKVILASPQSLGRNPAACGTFALVIVDESHLIKQPPTGSQYGKIFEAIKIEKILGLTGSPYRMDCGTIFGKDKFFQIQATSISTSFLQEKGFLCPHIFPRDLPVADLSKVKIDPSTKDFDTEEQEKILATEKIVRKAVGNWWAQAAARKCSLFFCCSIRHAEMVLEEIKKYTPHAHMIDGDTDTVERRLLVEKARNGEVKALVNVACLTTGLNVPVIDCIVFLRATKSPALFIQANGRGLRTAPGKRDCLILDMADNYKRFDNLDDPLIIESNHSVKVTPHGRQWVQDELKKMGIEEDDMKGPMKICPGCKKNVKAGWKVCRFCDHVFITHNYTPAQLRQKELEGWKLVNVQKYYFDDDYVTASSGRSCHKVTLIGEDVAEHKFYLFCHEQSGSTGKKTEHKKWLRFLKKEPPQVFIRYNRSGFPELQNEDHSL